MFQVLNRFKRPDEDDRSMPMFGKNFRAQDAIFIANLFWIPAYVRGTPLLFKYGCLLITSDRDLFLPFLLPLSAIFTSTYWATGFWAVCLICLALWSFFTRFVPLYALSSSKQR